MRFDTGRGTAELRRVRRLHPGQPERDSPLSTFGAAAAPRVDFLTNLVFPALGALSAATVWVSLSLKANVVGFVWLGSECCTWQY